MESLNLQIFEKMDVYVYPANIADPFSESKHRFQTSLLRFVIKKKLNGKNLTSLEINTRAYINDNDIMTFGNELIKDIQRV